MMLGKRISRSENREWTLGDISRARGREVLPIHFLVECATGYALFLAHGINDIDRIRYQAAEEYINRSDTPFELKDYLSFSSVDADPLLQMNAIFESNVTDELREFLKKNFEPPFRRHVLATADPIFGVNIVMKLGLCHRYETLIKHVMRGLREKIHEFIGLPHADLDKAQQDLVRRYNEQMRTKLDTESPVPVLSSFLQEHEQFRVVPHGFEGFFSAKGKKNLLCTRNLVSGEALNGEKLIRVQNEDGTEVEYRVCDPCRSKLGAAILGGVTNIWIKPGSRVIYVGNVCGLTVSDLSDLVGSDGFVYVVGFPDDVAHKAGNRPNVVTIAGKFSYSGYRMLLSMVDVVFGDIDDLPNKHNIEAGFILSHAHFYLKAGGHYMICTKANDMNSTGNAIFAYGDRQRQFKLIQTVMLDLVKGTYALDIGGYKMPVE